MRPLLYSINIPLHANRNLIPGKLSHIENSSIEYEILSFNTQQRPLYSRSLLKIECRHSRRVLQNRVGKRPNGFLVKNE